MLLSSRRIHVVIGTLIWFLCLNLYFDSSLFGRLGFQQRSTFSKDKGELAANATSNVETTTPSTSPLPSLHAPTKSEFVLNYTLNSSNRRPPCGRSQIRDGQWVSVELDRPPYVSRTKHLRCYPLEVYETKPWKSWKWVPFDKTCKLGEWDGKRLCRLLKFATVSIIGDSLSWEMYSSLLQLLGARVLQSSQHKSKSQDRNHAQVACEGKTKFVWRNDARLEKIQDSIENDFPSVLILNRGAHFANDTQLMSGILSNIELVRDWFTACSRRNIKCHFFWRTSVPGHPGCENFSEPVNDIAYMESRVADLQLYNNRSINYHWYDYQHQNKLVLKALEESELEYEVIDAYELNMRRPDEHRAHQGDCLHNCYPGKMDIYNQLLLHYLKMQRTKEDVQRLEDLFRSYLARSEEGREMADKVMDLED